MTKTPKFSIFQSFYAFFVKFLMNMVLWKVLKSQQGKSWLFSSLFEMKLSQTDTENDKNSEFFSFQALFFQISDGLCG